MSDKEERIRELESEVDRLRRQFPVEGVDHQEVPELTDEDERHAEKVMAHGEEYATSYLAAMFGSSRSIAHWLRIVNDQRKREAAAVDAVNADDPLIPEIDAAIEDAFAGRKRLEPTDAP